MAKVLIVDDDPLVRSALRDILTGDGLETLLAADGEAGLDASRRQGPAAILLDVGLPGWSGIDLLPDPDWPGLALRLGDFRL